MNSEQSDTALEDALIVEELKARMSVARREREGDAFAAGKKLLHEEIEEEEVDSHTEFNRSISKESSASTVPTVAELLHLPVVNISPQFHKEVNIGDSDDSDDEFPLPSKHLSNPPLPPTDADEAEDDIRYSELYKKAQEMHDREAKGRVLHSTVFSTALQAPLDSAAADGAVENTNINTNTTANGEAIINVVAQGSILIDSELVPPGTKPKKHVTFAEGTAPPAVSGIALAIIKHQQNPGGFMEYTIQVCSLVDTLDCLAIYICMCRSYRMAEAGY